MTVHLVGAGPGDPGLITVRGARLLGEADVVVYDRLVDSRLLDLAPPGAELLDVGKAPAGGGTAADGEPSAQERINAVLVDRGRAGLRVVRLKGGDPYLFGRGGEEAAALAEAGVPFEVVPGVPSAIAAPASAGIPVTHRDISSLFTVVTGQGPDVDWPTLARTGGTLVVLMGVAKRAEIAEGLAAGGKGADTPVAAVRSGTRADQQVVRTTLGHLADVDLAAPVVYVIGPVAALDLRGPRPLAGRSIVVTRARGQASELAERLREAGAEVLELPTIEIAAPADGGGSLRAAAANVDAFDWVVFTSANAVGPFVDCLAPPWPARVAAVGPGTAAVLAARGVTCHLVPSRARAEGLVEAFPDGPGSVLLPQAAGARPVLAAGLAAKGWSVTTAEAYRTVGLSLGPAEAARAAGADAIVFASGSAVTNLLAATADVPSALAPVVVCIGPVTAAAAESNGVAVSAVAGEPTLDGLVAATVAALSNRLAGTIG